MHFLRKWPLLLALVLSFTVGASAHAFTDITTKTYEYSAINTVIQNGWMTGMSTSTFGYGATINADDWLYMLMFLRTSDACPEFGTTPNTYWTSATIRACLSGAGVPIVFNDPRSVRRDEAMQQLFALRRRSFAFTQLQTKPAGYLEPLDLTDAAMNRQGALIAADRLKLIFRSSNHLYPGRPLLREDAALAVTRFVSWEKQGGSDKETNETQILSKEAVINHWRDVDTDLYVVQVKTGGDTVLRPILPRRSFNPAPDPKKEKLRDEFVYEPVSALAEQNGALAAINGSFFNVEWPWGALEDTTIVNGTSVLERTDRSTFVVCGDNTFYIGKYDQKTLKSLKCTPLHALGAGPRFITAGKIVTTPTSEGFDEYTQWERRAGNNARTAIAISKDRKTTYLIIVAGKSYPAFGRGGSSLGVFLKDKYPDLSDAMMYDGGSSTELYANHQVVVGMGVSGSKAERAVVSALGVFSKKADEAAKKQWKKTQEASWDASSVTIQVPKPTDFLAWQKVKDAKQAGTSIQLSGSRASQLQVLDSSDGTTKTYALTFDLFLKDTTSSLILLRREGHHERGWNIPTELHVINPKDGSDTDLIKLLNYTPVANRPDLKTLDVITTRKTGIVLGDASGRAWFYYAKDKQLSPATFVVPKAKTKNLAKTMIKTKK